MALVQQISFLYIIATAIVQLPQFGLFDLHPLCALLSLQVVSMGVGSFIGVKKQVAVNSHAQLQWSAIGALAVVLAVVEYGKFTKGYSHFVSWHGCIAAFTIATMTSQVKQGNSPFFTL